MNGKSWLMIGALACFLAGAVSAGTFGKVVAIGGHASDLALDEARGVVYVANFTANRIEVMSLSDASVQRSINVPPQPGALALSPDGRILLVAHVSNFQAPSTSNNALTVINLETGEKQTFVMGFPPLGLAFGIDNRALIVTTSDFLLFDPILGTTQVLDTVAGVTAKTLPVAPANFPPQIIAASVAASADGMRIFGLTDTIRFRYDVDLKRVVSLGYVAVPALGPRTVSVNREGSLYAAGWGLFQSKGIQDTLVAQWRNPSGALNIGSHAIDSERRLIYAQIPEAGEQATGTSAAPILMIADLDNLAIREKLQLPENLAGKSVLSSDGGTLYSVSDSGVLVLPVGSLGRIPRVIATQEDILIRGNSCDRRVATQELTIVDPGGNNTAFSIVSSDTAVTVSPSSGLTPATVKIRIDPSSFQNQKGTITTTLTIRSAQAVNVPPSVRVLTNLHDPDQRGTSVNVPGKLVDLLADPTRDRFYIVRQDKNQVLVFDGSTYAQIAVLRTGNTPTQMAITFDRRYLLVGNDNSQLASVFDLETLEPQAPIVFPGGHYPRSLASSGGAILAASRVAGPKHTIDRVDWSTRSAVTLPSLGVYENTVALNTVLVATPNGSSIMAAQSDGNVLLYNANVDNFTVSRKDFTALSGAFGASSYDAFVVGNYLLNASLVPAKKFESATGDPSGFAFVDQFGLRTTSAGSSSPGVIQRADLSSGDGARATRMVESPLLGDPTFAFTRTLAPLYNRSAIINLTTSGFTVLSWNYDAAVAPPRIDRIVNAADMTSSVAPGSLISLFGRDLSPVNIATSEMPLPTALGETCLTVNGIAVPMLFVSPSQINAQMPFQADGNVTLILRTPGGVSDNFNLSVLPGAPSVFRSGTAGPDTGIPTMLRDRNGELVTQSNPVHWSDVITIYLTGLGRTSPAVETGVPAPGDPPASVLVMPSVTLGGVPLQVNFAGLAPGQVGVYQINATVPRNVPLGMSVPLTISQSASSTVLQVRVVE